MTLADLGRSAYACPDCGRPFQTLSALVNHERACGEHGTVNRYKNGCRCADCRDAARRERQRWRPNPLTLKPDPEVTQDQSWRERANCRGMGPSAFFPERSDKLATRHPALSVCDGCEVVAECLAYCDALPDCFARFGVWGGTTPRMRRAMRKGRAS